MVSQILSDSGTVIAAVFAIALVVIFLFIVLLDRLGFKFTREKTKEENKPEKFEKSECPAHKDFTECISHIKKQQVINIETLKHHSEKFGEGKTSFEEIQNELKTISKNIGNLYKNIAVIAYALKIDPNKLERQAG